MAVDEEELLEAIEKLRGQGYEPDCIIVHRDCFVPDTELEIIRVVHIAPGTAHVGVKRNYVLIEGEGEWRGE